ncbi:MAG TPA: aminodeoxychorismate lyase [Bacillales bacterium]|nr:aminodeoxychorismate lyase [Bacillales bacterium]
MFIYLNGSIVDEKEAAISPFDHGYIYGMGVFETFRTYGGHPFLFDDHLERLRNGLSEMGIEWRETRESLLEALSELLAKNDLEDASIRLNVSAGIAANVPQADVYRDPTTIVFLRRLPATIPNHKAVKVLSTVRNSPEGEVRLKSHHFFNNILGKREVGPDPDTEGVFLTENGHLAEGVTSNIFWVKNGVVFTPSIDTGILNGITRQFVLTLCEENRIPFKTGKFKVDALYDSEEVFITNSGQEIVPINRVDLENLPSHEGKVTQRLKQWYHTYRNHLWSRNEMGRKGAR